MFPTVFVECTLQRVFYAGDFIATRLIGWLTRMELSDQLAVMLAFFEPFDVSMVMFAIDLFWEEVVTRGLVCCLREMPYLSQINLNCKTACIFV